MSSNPQSEISQSRLGESNPKSIQDMPGRKVVLDTAGPIIYLGTLREVAPSGFALEDADVHDCREGHASKELYVCEAARDGIRVNRRRVFVFREAVMSVSLLEDVAT